MLKILAVIGIIVAVAIIVVLVMAARKPDVFRVQRAAVIKAPPEKIFPLLNNFRNWGGWSPWEKMDPDLKRNYSGAPEGKGAVYDWVGNNKVGQGRMEITDSVPAAKVALNLDFIKPFEAHNKVVFTLAPVGDGTDVSWDMQGPIPFMFKIMHVFMNMDRMVGKDFEAGLANLKAQAEKP
jgi:polyketide cyclase/dehydrase/lipid transport protein